MASRPEAVDRGGEASETGRRADQPRPAPNGSEAVAVNLYSFVDLYARGLDTAAHLLTKGADFAKARGDRRD